ncbi:MAG: biotin--[acetyl-CoA-carboxylase] ligase [Rickettsiales bacterium]
MVTVSEEKPRLIELYHLLSYDEVDSTNEEAKRLALGGGAEGAVLWAKKQTAGRGRMGRSWVSEEGNLFVSILLKPTTKEANWPQLSFVTALAVHDAILPMLETDPDLTLKWPNDILLKGKKVGGILLEMFADESRQNWLTVGIGINIEDYPRDVMYPATCLKANGIEIVSAKIVLSRFLSCFMERYDRWIAEGFSSMQKEWQQHAYNLGKKISIATPRGEISGVFTGIDVTGHLLLDQKGVILPVMAGDVTEA